jgi:hypothetical protein
MRKLRQWLIVSSIVFVMSTTASAQRLGLNLAANDPDPASSSLLPGDIAGVVPQGNWNNLEGNTGSNASPLFYENAMGLPVESTVSVSWSGPNTWRSTANNAFTDPGDLIMTTGYLDSNDTSAGRSEITVSNIDAALRTPSYDVYVYFVSDDPGNRGGGYTLTPAGGSPVVKYGSTLAAPDMHVEDPGTDIDNSIDGTYLRFPGITGDSFTLTGDASLTTPNGFRAPMSGVQIVKSTLIPGDVNGDGQVNINDFHIIRGNLFKTGQTRPQGDLVSDGIVDFADFREWKQNAPAGLAASASLAGSIPEPATGLLLAIGGALAALASRRRVSSEWRTTHQLAC